MNISAAEALELVRAGFTAEEIRNTFSAGAAPAADPEQAKPAGNPVFIVDRDTEPAPAPDPKPEPAPAPDPVPESAAPGWFTDFVKKNNEEMAAMQRAFQLTNVRRAEVDHGPMKTADQLAAEAFNAVRNYKEEK